MNYYEQYLWSKALDAAPQREISTWIDYGLVHVEAAMSHAPVATGPTLEAALRALLDDLGVEYEERPSAEDVIECRRSLNEFWHNAGMLRSLDRLTVLALLAGEA